MPKLTSKLVKAAAEAKEVNTSFEAWPAGKYIATLAKVDTRESKAGNEYWVAEFSNFEDLDGKKYPGRQWLNINLPIAEMPADWLPKKMRDAGETVESVDQEARTESWENYQGMTVGRIKEFFEAFGFTIDSDTDELIGEQCIVKIGQETSNYGQRKGERVNTVAGLAPLESAGVVKEDTDF